MYSQTESHDTKDNVVNDLKEINELITDINKGETLPNSNNQKNEKIYNPFNSLRRLSIIDSPQ